MAGGPQTRIAVAAGGTLAAVSMPGRIEIVAVPDLTREGEIAIDADAEGFDAGWVGNRLLVLSWYPTHSIVYLLDPQGPRAVAQLRLDGPMRLGAVAGSHALAVGSLGPVVIGVGDTQLAPYTFPSRAKPTVAGAAEALLLVALPAAIEEWDPQIRMPKRRLRLPRAVTITALGGSHRVVWMVTDEDARRIDVVPLVNRGQPRVHELPEPIASVSSHPRSDIVVCVGATSGRLYAIDLDGRTRMRVIALSSIGRVSAAAIVVARGTSALVAQDDRPLVLVPLDDREPEARPAPASPARVPLGMQPDARGTSTLYGDPDDAPASIAMAGPGPAPARPAPLSFAPLAFAPMTAPVPVMRADAIVDATPPAQPISGGPVAPLSLTPAATAAPVEAAPIIEKTGPQTLATRLSRRREELAGRVSESLGGVAVEAPEPVLAPSPVVVRPVVPAVPGASSGVPTRTPAMQGGARGRTWRDDLVAWVRTLASDPAANPPPPALGALLERIADQFGVRPHIAAVARLYAGHLCGEQGVAPADIARAPGGGWDEALGRGKLAALRVAAYSASRVHLAAPILRMLDELAPMTGSVIGVAGPVALLSPCAVIAEDDDLHDVAERLMPVVGGAILVAEDEADPDEVLLEARARGAVALMRFYGELADLRGEPAVLVVSDAEAADALGIPRLA